MAQRRATRPRLAASQALIQPYRSHVTRQSLEVDSRLVLADAQRRSHEAIGNFPSGPARSRSFAPV